MISQRLSFYNSKNASKYAYATTVYLRQKTGYTCINNLIFLKARKAPNKEINITRLMISNIDGCKMNEVWREGIKIENRIKTYGTIHFEDRLRKINIPALAS